MYDILVYNEPDLDSIHRVMCSMVPIGVLVIASLTARAYDWRSGGLLNHQCSHCATTVVAEAFQQSNFLPPTPRNVPTYSN